jgi:protein tyrosine/serine phosphatase
MKLTPKHKRQPHVAADLDTPSGRKRAWRELVLEDQGFLRESFQNLHQIGPGIWRSNQPNPDQIADHARIRGVRTIINLRGESTKGYYLLEREACRRAGVHLVDFRLFSRDTPSKEVIFRARDLFRSVEYPALMHCKSGADRAGLMAALYCIFQLEQPVALAARQLSKKYLHLREGKTGLLDAFFEAYLHDSGNTTVSFSDWVEGQYDPAAVKHAFLRSGRGRLRLDQWLRRE